MDREEGWRSPRLDLPHATAPCFVSMLLSASLTLVPDGAAHCLRGHRGNLAHEGPSGTATAIHVSDPVAVVWSGLSSSPGSPSYHLHFLLRSSHQDNLQPVLLTLQVDYTLQASLSLWVSLCSRSFVPEPGLPYPQGAF